MSISLSSCHSTEKQESACALSVTTDTLYKVFFNEILSPIEQQMMHLGLVDVCELDSTIRANIKYSTEDNFLKKDMYGDYNKAYLQPDVAEKLSNAQTFLKEQHPGYRLVVYDAARPVSIQKIIWDSLKMPSLEKGKFACNPRHGSLHNYGAAIDVSILDEKGHELDMGCPFDFFGPLAYPVMESQLLSEGRLSQQQISNRKLLRQVMYKAGFFNIQTEWWHFNSCTRAEAIIKYKKIE
ncbi:MAG TPA: M15 family metallopeptidase [Bacteroidales bacterium]|nr:M15 family metallopeptidase [Bacteroidales bacterium]